MNLFEFKSSTPLEGLIMGTRCGDIDPAIITHLLTHENITADELYILLNKKSGILGVSGITNDMRSILKAVTTGNERAILTLNMFAYRVKKYIASYLGTLNGTDAIVFTAGIGAHSPTVREKCMANLESLGIIIDDEKNKNTIAEEGIISSPDSKIKVMVIPTDEELMISREVLKVLTK